MRGGNIRKTRYPIIIPISAHFDRPVNQSLLRNKSVIKQELSSRWVFVPLVNFNNTVLPFIASPGRHSSAFSRLETLRAAPRLRSRAGDFGVSLSRGCFLFTSLNRNDTAVSRQAQKSRGGDGETRLISRLAGAGSRGRHLYLPKRPAVLGLAFCRTRILLVQAPEPASCGLRLVPVTGKSVAGAAESLR